MQKLADSIGVSKEQLSYFLSARLKVKYLQWRKELRIREAVRILKMHPGISLNDLGYRVGICDKSNFRREFFEVTGYYPSEWKEIGRAHV